MPGHPFPLTQLTEEAIHLTQLAPLLAITPFVPQLRQPINDSVQVRIIPSPFDSFLSPLQHTSLVLWRARDPPLEEVV